LSTESAEINSTCPNPLIYPSGFIAILTSFTYPQVPKNFYIDSLLELKLKFPTQTVVEFGSFTLGYLGALSFYPPPNPPLPP